LNKKQIRKYTLQDRALYIQSCLAYKKYSREEIVDILKFDQEFIQLLLLKGECILMPNFGSFRLKYKSAKDEYIGINPKTLEKITIPAHDEYNRVKFVTSSIFAEELKEKTYGNAILPVFRDDEKEYEEEEELDGEEIITG